MSMLDSFFNNKGFKAAKCKTLLKLTVPRIKLLRNRREIQIKQMRRDIAKLLETGQEATARIRVEHIIREEKMMAAQEILELFCELIAVRLPIIEAQRECPLDLKEAISSVCFAAPRCADLPELIQVQMLFLSKYGKEFVAAATELIPDCGVNRQLIELLSVRAPSPESKLKLLKEIAEEHKLEWYPATSETELFKSHEDLLNRSNQFVSGSRLPLPNERHEDTLYSSSEQLADYEPALSMKEEHKQFLPFVSTLMLSSSSFSAKEPCPPSVPTFYRSKSEMSSIDLQDVLAAAQAAADTAERATAAEYTDDDPLLGDTCDPMVEETEGWGPPSVFYDVLIAQNLIPYYQMQLRRKYDENIKAALEACNKDYYELLSDLFKWKCWFIRSRCDVYVAFLTIKSFVSYGGLFIFDDTDEGQIQKLIFMSECYGVSAMTRKEAEAWYGVEAIAEAEKEADAKAEPISKKAKENMKEAEKRMDAKREAEKLKKEEEAQPEAIRKKLKEAEAKLKEAEAEVEATRKKLEEAEADKRKRKKMEEAEKEIAEADEISKKQKKRMQSL